MRTKPGGLECGVPGGPAVSKTSPLNKNSAPLRLSASVSKESCVKTDLCFLRLSVVKKTKTLSLCVSAPPCQKRPLKTDLCFLRLLW
jgi:hypothetical protein